MVLIFELNTTIRVFAPATLHGTSNVIPYWVWILLVVVTLHQWSANFFYHSPDHLVHSSWRPTTFETTRTKWLIVKQQHQSNVRVLCACVVVQTQAICNCRRTARAVFWFTSYFPNLLFFQLTTQGDFWKTPVPCVKVLRFKTYWKIFRCKSVCVCVLQIIWSNTNRYVQHQNSWNLTNQPVTN